MNEIKKIEKILKTLGPYEKTEENVFIYDTTTIKWIKDLSVSEHKDSIQLLDVDENLIRTYLEDGSYKNKTMIIIGKIEMC